MNSREKEYLKYSLAQEKKVLEELKELYKQSLDDINREIAYLRGRTDTENLSSIIYQLNYQKALKKQVGAILDTLHSKEYSRIEDYLKDCYEDGYIGSMYSIHGQGIPITMPIDQEQLLNALTTDSKLSKDLYDALGEDVTTLKRKVQSEISRGIASNFSYDEIARNLSNISNSGLYNAYRIARTEGHRIQSQSSFDAANKAKEAGADVVKQWDASLDSRTRPHHAQLDGQIKELEEPFEVAGRKAMHPSDFGIASEDINCRCALLQRARWALDEDELDTLKQRAEYYGLDKSKDFEDFKKKYLKASDDLILKAKSGKINIEIDELTPCLRRASDGKIVNTSVSMISPTKAEFKDWEFDWTEPERNGFNVFQLKVDGDDRVQGLIALKPDTSNSAVYVRLIESAPFNNPHNRLFTNKEYSGVGGHLFAEAIRQSYEYGFDGYVYFKSKTNLIDYYTKELGAVLINPRDNTMAIDERSAKVLYDKYYGKKQ